jgi:hypothetical protein
MISLSMGLGFSLIGSVYSNQQDTTNIPPNAMFRTVGGIVYYATSSVQNNAYAVRNSSQ